MPSKRKAKRGTRRRRQRDRVKYAPADVMARGSRTRFRHIHHPLAWVAGVIDVNGYVQVRPEKARIIIMGMATREIARAVCQALDISLDAWDAASGRIHVPAADQEDVGKRVFPYLVNPVVVEQMRGVIRYRVMSRQHGAKGGPVSPALKRYREALAARDAELREEGGG